MPWRPSPTSTLEATYDYYEIPLCGVVRQGDREFLFICTDGQMGPVHYWLHAPLSAEERRSLEATSTPQEFDARIDRFDFTAATLSVATDTEGILDWRAI